MRLALLALLGTAACAPRIAIGLDQTAKTTGPLANLMPIARSEAITGVDKAPVPTGKNYSLGLGFGDKTMQLGMRIQANNVSATTLGDDGPQYLSAEAALDFRYSFIRWKGIGAGITLAPGRTVLIDSTTGDRSWGSGVRYGGLASYNVGPFGVFADVYQEKLFFVDGPAQGTTSRSGITLGVAFQP